jgi:hypothetical protein
VEWISHNLDQETFHLGVGRSYRICMMTGGIELLSPLRQYHKQNLFVPLVGVNGEICVCVTALRAYHESCIFGV